MNKVFKPYLDTSVVVFIDDMLIYSKSRKWEFWLDRVHFLGHVVTMDGISMDLAKVEVIVNWPRPTTMIEVMSSLGMTGYYKRFVEGFTKLALPITRLICKNTKFE